MSDLVSSSGPAWLFSVVLEGVRRLAKGREQLSVVRERSDSFVRAPACIDLLFPEGEGPKASDLPSLTRAASAALGSVQQELELRSSPIRAGSGASTIKLLRHSFHRPGDAEPLGSLIEKVIERPARKNIAYLWAQEAAVYADAEKFKDAAGVRLPTCYGLFWRRGRIHLYIEDVRGCAHPREPQQLFRAGEALGRFGGWAAREGLWKLAWLSEPSGSEGRLVIRGSHVRKGLDRVTSGPAVAARLLEGYRAVQRALPHAMDLIQASPSTVAHLDAHAGNILLPKSGGRLYLLDWAKAGRGRLGDDLLTLASPRHHLLDRGRGLDEFLAFEAALLDRYLEGVSACHADVAEEDVRRYYDVRSLIGSVRWLERGGHINDAVRALQGEERQNRWRAMEEFLQLQYERTRQALFR